MSLDQLRTFLGRMQDEPALHLAVQTAGTAKRSGPARRNARHEFSGDALLRHSCLKVGRVTVTKQDIPVEYN